MRYFAALLLALFLPVSAVSQESLVAGLSQDEVSITATFDGSEIFIFGAVKRDQPIPEDVGPLEVAIIIEGPGVPVVVRRKERKLGIWVNDDSVHVDSAPSFHAIATTGPLNEIISSTEQLRHKIGINETIRVVGEVVDDLDIDDFREALIRVRTNSGLYSETEGVVDLKAETLFSANIALPSNLVEGDYHAKIFLARDRKIISRLDTVIEVRKEGLERWVYSLAHEQPFLYGVLAIAVALAAGWLASEIFRLLRR